MITGPRSGQGVGMSVRRSHRRGRSRPLGLSVDLLKPWAPLQDRPTRPVPGPARPRTAPPVVRGTVETGKGWEDVPVTVAGCCAAVRRRDVREGGGVIVWTRHAAGCPVWSVR